MSTREYSNGRHDPPSNSMNLRKLYIGGIPNHVVAPHLTNRYVEVTESDVIQRRKENTGSPFALKPGLTLGYMSSNGCQLILNIICSALV